MKQPVVGITDYVKLAKSGDLTVSLISKIKDDLRQIPLISASFLSK